MAKLYASVPVGKGARAAHELFMGVYHSHSIQIARLIERAQRVRRPFLFARNPFRRTGAGSTRSLCFPGDSSIFFRPPSITGRRSMINFPPLVYLCFGGAQCKFDCSRAPS